MSLIERFNQASSNQKWLGIGASIIGVFIIILIIREILFWSIFGDVMSQVKSQNQAVEKRQQEILEQANLMQQQMNEKAKDFKSSMQQQASKIQKETDDGMDLKVMQEDANAKIGPSALSSKIDDQIMEDSLLRNKVDNIRQNASFDHSNTKQYLELSLDEQQVVKQLIANYRATHPNLLQRPGTVTSIKLSPADQIALIQMIRDYNNKILEKEEYIDGEGSRTLARNNPSSMERGAQHFQKALNQTMDDMNNDN